MNIAVLGGGNIGTQFACISASKGHDVNIYTSKPELWSSELEAHNDDGSITRGQVSLISDDISQVLDGRNIIFITYPAFMFREISELILPHIHEGMYMGVIPGTGGAEYAFSGCIRSGAGLFGLQRVPSVARIIEYGRSVRTEGYRNMLELASIPHSESPKLADFISELFGIPCGVLPNYLNVTLTPSNPILHTTRLRTLFHDYGEWKIYPENPLFYGDWSNESSELLFRCDDELQKICSLLYGLDMSGVKSLKIHYESSTPEQLTRKIRSIKSLNKLRSPMKEHAGGWIPDFSSRYFTADFPFGLAIIEDIADLLNFRAQNITETMKWYRDITGDTSRFSLSDYNIKNMQDFYNIYQQKGLDKMKKATIIDTTRHDTTRHDTTRHDTTPILVLESRLSLQGEAA